MSVIFRLHGVRTDLICIYYQQYGAEQENKGASNLYLVLHNTCLPVHSALNDYKKKSLRAKEHTYHQPNVSACIVVAILAHLSKCLQGVELGSVECMRFDILEAVSKQIPVRDTM